MNDQQLAKENSLYSHMYKIISLLDIFLYMYKIGNLLGASYLYAMNLSIFYYYSMKKVEMLLQIANALFLL